MKLLLDDDDVYTREGLAENIPGNCMESKK